MLTFEPAREAQYAEFFQMMRDLSAAYLETTLALTQLTWQDFERLFRSTGQVFGIYEEGQLAGFYWIEQRERVLHLHGPFVKPSFQGHGIGSQVLKMLESEYSSRVNAVELGVHDSNAQAKSLYEKVGFETIKRLDELGFSVMQKRLQTVEPA